MAGEVGRCLLPQLLKAKGLTQQDLADKLSIPKSQISEYATGRRVMSLKTANAIAGALGCTIDDLYEWKK